MATRIVISELRSQLQK